MMDDEDDEVEWIANNFFFHLKVFRCYFVSQDLSRKADVICVPPLFGPGMIQSGMCKARRDGNKCGGGAKSGCCSPAAGPMV
jgi:hypothetical protein